jgi:ADP-ribose pyrophosphatase YjhB (NUDIX family)
VVNVGVAVAVLHGGRVLLTKREDFEVWCLPGGGLEPGESVAQAAVREVREETGLEVALTRLVGVYSRPQWTFGATCLLFLAARPAGGALRPDPREVVEAGYFAADALPAPLFGHHQAAIRAALAGVSGAAWSNDAAWPFPGAATRQELYDLRDRSGLTRLEFYLRYFEPSSAGGHTLEVAGVTAGGSRDLDGTRRVVDR